MSPVSFNLWEVCITVSASRVFSWYLVILFNDSIWYWPYMHTDWLSFRETIREAEGWLTYLINWFSFVCQGTIIHWSEKKVLWNYVLVTGKFLSKASIPPPLILASMISVASFVSSENIISIRYGLGKVMY